MYMLCMFSASVRYMDNLCNNCKLCRAEYSEKKLFRGVARTHVQGGPDEIIQQEVKSKKNRTK